MSVIYDEDGKPSQRGTYEWKSASVTVTGVDPTTSLKTITGFTTMFDTVTAAHRVTIQCSGTAYIRLNSATADVITVTSTNPYTDSTCVVNKIFVATNNIGVTVTVILR